MQQDKVIVVNEQDEPLGVMDKLEAHEKGVLHRAFSIFVLNDKNELLIQRRALNKYHSKGLWSNTCCSHPMPDENTLDAAHRRLKEEMGFDCELHRLFPLRYCAEVGNGLTENEYHHVYLGHYNGIITPNSTEVIDYKFVSVEDLMQIAETQPANFTAWFHLALPKFIASLKSID